MIFQDIDFFAGSTTRWTWTRSSFASWCLTHNNVTKTRAAFGWEIIWRKFTPALLGVPTIMWEIGRKNWGKVRKKIGKIWNLRFLFYKTCRHIWASQWLCEGKIFRKNRGKFGEIRKNYKFSSFFFCHFLSVKISNKFSSTFGLANHYVRDREEKNGENPEKFGKN